MADNEDKEVVALEQNVRKVTIEYQGVADKNEGEEKRGGGVMGFFKNMGQTIGGLFKSGAPDADIAGFHVPVIKTKRADGFHIPVINTERVETMIDVLMDNPNPEPILLVDMIYEISSDGHKLCSGTIPDVGTVHAYGSKTVKIPLTLALNAYDDIEPGRVYPYLAKFTLLEDDPVTGRITIPLEKTGEMTLTPYSFNWEFVNILGVNHV